MTDISVDRTRTSGEEVVIPQEASPIERTRTRSSHDLVQEAGLFRNQVRLVSDDASDIHHRALEVHFDKRARELAKRLTIDLLGELADEGFSWRDIARMAGVSVPALRKWRLGDAPTPDHLLRIAKIVAMVELLHEEMIRNAAAWLEVPIASEAPVTGIDLLSGGAYDLVVDYATQNLSGEQALTLWQSDWRSAYRSDFEIFEAPDGEPGLRPKRE